MCENAQLVLDVSYNEGGYILKRIFHCFNFAFDKHLVNQAISADVCVYAEWCHLLNFNYLGAFCSSEKVNIRKN